jgi:glycosyltransferase involved in cell wall biosynthesis
LEVSIITINRNNAYGLSKTIESVLLQAYKDYQFIIIDGNSSDESVDIIKKFAPHIHEWVSESDNGIYEAMNKGIVKAQGRYLLFLNSGDCLANNNVLQRVFASSPVEDIIYGDIIYEGASKAMEMPDSLTLETFLGSSIGHAASFIKSDLFKKYGLYNEDNKIVSDWEFFLNVCIKNHCSTRHVNEVFTVYQQGGITQSKAHFQVQRTERLRSLKALFPDFYDLIVTNEELKSNLDFYENSRLIQILARLQRSKLNQLRNKWRRRKV